MKRKRRDDDFDIKWRRSKRKNYGAFVYLGRGPWESDYQLSKDSDGLWILYSKTVRGAWGVQNRPPLVYRDKGWRYLNEFKTLAAAKKYLANKQKQIWRDFRPEGR